MPVPNCTLQDLRLAQPLASLLRASVFELYRLQVELHELLPDLMVGGAV